MTRAPRGSRITPLNVDDLPSVLDTAQVANVLRVRQDKVRQLTAAGLLRRLAYSPRHLYDKREVLRFLEEQTEAEPKQQQRAS
jgi:hypothetical protein